MITELAVTTLKKPKVTEKKPGDKVYRVGQIVTPSVGPHAGKPHKIIHIHDDGSMNITPTTIESKHIAYKLGAAKCTPKQLKEETIEETSWDKANRYLTKAAKSRSKADKEGDVKTVEKRERGVGMAFNKLTEKFDNWSLRFKKGDSAKVTSGDNVGTRGTVTQIHNDGESYTLKHKDGTEKQHHISTLDEGKTHKFDSESGETRVDRYLAHRRKKITGSNKPQKEVNEERSSLRLVKSYENGTKSAKVYKDSDWDEHRVKFYSNGVHQDKADYHTDDASDAHDTAKHYTKSTLTSQHTMKENVENISELSVKTSKSYIEKAGQDRYTRGIHTGVAVANAADPEEKDRSNKTIANNQRKTSNRGMGTLRAVDSIIKKTKSGISEHNLLEARRGRPPKNPSANREADEREHPMMQLRKNVNTGGTKPIKFEDGSTHDVSSAHATKALRIHDDLEKPNQKQAFAAFVGKSHKNLVHAASGGKINEQQISHLNVGSNELRMPLPVRRFAAMTSEQIVQYDAGQQRITESRIALIKKIVAEDK